MNKNTLLIIAALALPLALLAVVIHSGSPSFKNTPPAAGNATRIAPHATLEQARAQVRGRLAQLEAMTPEQWPQEQKIHPHVPPTLEQALANNRKRLAQMNAMTPEQWEALFKPKPATAQQPKPAAAQ